MRLSINSDTYLDSIISFRRELEYVCEKVNKKYVDVDEPSEIGISLRYLPDEIGRKTFQRYSKTEKYLTVDITVSYEQFKRHYKIEQRHELGNIIYAELKEAFSKYKFLDSFSGPFLVDFKVWCNDIGWLLDEIDYTSLD